MLFTMKTHSGFTLIEVLISMLILAVGLLGLAALQTSTLRSNLAAYNHGQATQLLYDISDRMRANNCEPNFTCTSAANAYITTDSNTYAQGHTFNTNCTTVTTAANAICTPTVLANNDLIEWNTAIATTLPMGKGSVTSPDNPATANSIFTLAVTWDDDRDGVIDSTKDPTFTMSLQP
jgi:type IV pilus assembly protein PilV